MAEERTPPGPTGREDEDAFAVVYEAQLQAGAAKRVDASALPDDAVYEEKSKPKRVDEPEPQRDRDKVHPLLREWLDRRSDDEREQIVVVLADPISIPRFPEPATDEPWDSDRNRQLLKRAQELVRRIQAERAPGYERLEAELADFEAELVELFWLINGVVAEIPLKYVELLARRDDILSLEPRFSGEDPPQNEVDDGRARIVSDPYFNLTGGRIGLLDTGVRFTHTLFTNPSNIGFRRDCINGGADCNTGINLNPDDDYWDHGTSSAAIIVANANQGNNFRGVTRVTLDSFKVYASAATFAGLDAAAAVCGFQAAVQVLDRVIVAEMQGEGDHNSGIAQAADAAFNAGVVVIAANGNNGPNDSTVNCPANARRAIGVGAFDVQTLQQTIGQSRGPTADGRFKPDIQAPTNTETASNASDTARQVFGGTSGATPYASGAAALLRNWLRGTSSSIDPGQVYAFLILYGQTPYPFDNTSGAGPLRLPTDGTAWWGKVSVTNQATTDIPLTIGSRTANTLDAAIWWPESGIHNDIDLLLIDPPGNVRVSSDSGNSVFERCRVVGAVAPGTWQVRIRGFGVPAGPQTVYWAAHVRL